MSIRKKLRARAAIELHDMMQALKDSAGDIVTRTQVTPEELCKLVANPEHSKTLIGQLLPRMANHAEERLAERLDAEDEPS